MPAIIAQPLPANGEGLTVVQTAVVGTAHTFANTGRELYLLFAGATPATSDSVIDGVAAADSGRDGTVTLGGAMTADDLIVAGPFKPRNFNTGGIVELTVAVPATLSHAVIRFDPNG